MIAAAFTAAAAPDVDGEEVKAPVGRFLYAGDDDWDWASPLGAKEPCKLARYGPMPWSALDWAEEGLEEVRGALIGVAPDPKKTMTMEELSDLRGEKATYRHHVQAAGAIENLLKEENPPNVIILMQNLGKPGALDADSIATLTRFLKAGGRLVVLDDWKRYHGVLEVVMTEALKLPPGPPIEEPPPPKPKEATPSPEPKDAEPAKEVDNKMRERFAELLPALSDDKFRVREAASAGIKELGPKVLEFFADAGQDDPEVRFRLRKIREALTPKTSKTALTQEQRDAKRAAKHELNANLIRSAATKLRTAQIPHHLSDIFVDKEKRALPALRIEFPVQ